MRSFLTLIGVLLCAASPALAQQTADTTFQAVVPHPTYAPGSGPVVRIDAAHNNFHTADGRYQPFAAVLRADGFVVESSTESFSEETLVEVDILVVANALHENNLESWRLPTPSAFSAAEIAGVRAWVEQGGSLLLLADHMPFPGAAAKLAAAFGFRFNNGFALDTLQQAADLFHRRDSLLLDHPITQGRTTTERIDSVRSFTGQAFQASTEAEPLLVMGPTMVSLMPEVAWQFDDQTPHVSVAGWLQGAVQRIGAGRVAVFGEAAMFTAQYLPQQQLWFGLRAPGAEQNQTFLLNVMHWLAGELD